MDSIFKKHKLPKFDWDETDNLNSPTAIKKIKCVIKDPPPKKSQYPGDFTM